MAKKLAKINHTKMTIEQLEAAEIAAREQYQSSLEIINYVDPLPSLEEITKENVEDGQFTGGYVSLAGADELFGQAIDLKQDFETWSEIVHALVKAKYPAHPPRPKRANRLAATKRKAALR